MPHGARAPAATPGLGASPPGPTFVRPPTIVADAERPGQLRRGLHRKPRLSAPVYTGIDLSTALVRLVAARGACSSRSFDPHALVARDVTRAWFVRCDLSKYAEMKIARLAGISPVPPMTTAQLRAARSVRGRALRERSRRGARTVCCSGRLVGGAARWSGWCGPRSRSS